MKLHHLHIENITSLKGKHFIDFHAIAQQSEIFAITGPTGSGKSSILMAISLALYGDTIKNALNAGDYVTQGMAGGHIELTFTVHGQKYMALWHCTLLKKNGEKRKKPQTMRKIINCDTQEDLKIEEIIDLTFDQFNKVAILNQGRFADFLNASFSERKNLLETIIGDDSILQIGKNLRTTLSYYEKEIDFLKRDHQQTLLLTPDELEQASSELAELIKHNQNARKRGEVISSFSSLSQEIYQGQVKYRKACDRLNQENTNLELINSHLDQAKQIEKQASEALDHFLKTYQSKNKELSLAAELNEKIKVQESTTDKLTNNYHNIKSNLDKTHQKLTACHQNIETIQYKIDHDYLTLTKCELTPDEILSKYHEYIELSEQRDIKEVTKKSIEQEIKRLQQEITQYQDKKVQYQELYGDENPNQVHSRLSDKKLAKQHLEYQIKQYVDDIATHKNTLDKLLKQAKECGILHNQYLNQHKELQKKIDHVVQAIASQEKQYRALKNYEHIIDSYKQGHTSCHVCHQNIDEQTIQTITKKKNNLVNDTDHIGLQSLKELENTYQQELEQTMIKVTTTEQDLKNIELKKQELEKRIHELQGQKDFAKNDLKQYQSIEKDIENISHFVHYFKLNYAAFVKNEQLYEKAAKHFAETKCDIDTLSKSIEFFHNQLFSIFMTPLSKQHHMDIKKQIADYNDHEKDLSQNKKMERQLQSERQEIAEQLKEAQSLVKKAEQETKELKEQYQLNRYPEDPTAQIIDLKDQKNNFEKTLHTKQALRRDHEIEKEKKEGIKRTLLEQCDELQKQYAIAKHRFLELFQNHRDLFEQETTHYNEKMAQWFDDDFGKHDEQSIDVLKEYAQILYPRLVQELSDDYQESLKKQTIIETKISENEKQVQKTKHRQEKLKQLQKEQQDFKDLEHYIGKDRFRDYALSVIEKNLLILANNEIKDLAAGRYQLIHGREGIKKEFLVKDKWQGSILRKVSTLSGGETFMLSLGLALALSSLNSGQTTIDFFFIDEGFGTLDSECIDDVLECLMSLQNRGKYIGLISHVKELTSRIPLSIELQKNQWGESQVSY